MIEYLRDEWRPLAFILGGAVILSVVVIAVLARIDGDSWASIGNGIAMALVVLPVVIAAAFGLAAVAVRRWP